MLVAHLMVLAALAGGGGGGQVERALAPAGALQAAQLVAQDFGEGTTCRREGPAQSSRFFCVLPSMEGELEIRMSPDAQRYKLIPRTVHRTVAAESPAELHAARLVPPSDIAHVVCTRKAPRKFTCDGKFNEPGYRTGIEFGLEITKAGHYFLVPCRITWLGSILACQHLVWDVNFPQGELEGMEKEQEIAG
jgi:hypothetical protein